MVIEEEQLDRAKGCLIGLAIGDAMGAPVEFCDHGTFEPVSDYRYGGPFNLKAGQWTDDTSQALCLADSLILQGQYDEIDFARRLLNWYTYGYNSSTGKCFDIGVGTQLALNRFSLTGQVASLPSSAGNGCIMRLAPVPIAFFRDIGVATEKSKESCKVTHGHPEAFDCAGYLGSLLAELILSKSASETYNFEVGPAFVKIASSTHPELKEYEKFINVSGQVTDTLAAALFCFHATETFEECILKAVNLGGDTDSVGAVAGQMAGAYYGLSSIPENWVSKLQDCEQILSKADQLFHLHPNHGNS